MTARRSGTIVLAGALLAVAGLLSYGVARGADAPAAEPGWHGDGAYHDGWRHGEGHGGFGGMMMFRRLDLTVPQQHQMVDVLAKHRADLRQKAEQVHKARQALMQAMLRESPDRQAIAADFDKAASARKELMLARLDLRQDMMAVLTADQKAKLQAFRAKRLEWMKEHTGERE